ncbi:hypothetical protein HY947_04130 [Candidatus Gottesmanbacteria bacterium]|nr:hypothetical protein [Candidatus Gottesmanbacteria bacterium]
MIYSSKSALQQSILTVLLGVLFFYYLSFVGSMVFSALSMSIGVSTNS